MKILLLGEFSGLHANLAAGLKELGHDVTVASAGDGWKNYPRDIDFNYKGKNRKIKLLWAILKNTPKLIGYDVVQLVNPNFLDAKPMINRLVFEFVNLFNKSIFLGANGNDYYYVSYGLSGKYSKSVFNDASLLKDDYVRQYVKVPLSNIYKKYNHKIAKVAKGITACCAEYELAYREQFGQKLTFIPLPIQTQKFMFCNEVKEDTKKISFFMGHYKDRQVLKGTDVIHRVLKKIERDYPNDVMLNIVDSVPFEVYQKLFNNSHILVDQLYSYGCGLNGVLGMSKGMVVAGGADEHMYKLMEEHKNFPLINLPIDEEDMYVVFENLIKQKKSLPKLAKASRKFAEEHHDYLYVAKEYVRFWEQKI
ncbi:glycosyltransferase [Carboxylicivirga linearis]|uniref:Glycosyltransferase n=1 Tax=Carboxylicivirga linearis TaxID=1628157 RepID=A0ABS5JV85_9BACT|nr:hypothetical protein [Carboxylicivirga linearis]MBS2098231.1 hypothetical protein [Carboxylicivirga linearis]